MPKTFQLFRNMYPEVFRVALLVFNACFWNNSLLRVATRALVMPMTLKFFKKRIRGFFKELFSNLMLVIKSILFFGRTIQELVIRLSFWLFWITYPGVFGGAVFEFDSCFWKNLFFLVAIEGLVMLKTFQFFRNMYLGVLRGRFFRVQCFFSKQLSL